MSVEQNEQRTPMISVVVPVYNEEEHIYRCIKSILNQTIPDFEIVIVDDGSTDKSIEVIKRIGDARISVIQQHNAGVSAARNRGTEEASCQFIAFLDADDEWLPTHLETMMHLVNKYPDCSVYSTNYKIIDVDGNERLPVNTGLILPNSEQDGIFANYFEVASKTGPPIFTSAVLIRKDALVGIGGFPPGVTAGEDLLVWARLACAFSLAYASQVTVHYHFLSYGECVLFARKQDPRDYVGKSLEELRANCRDKSGALDRYILLWYRMRLINYMKFGDKANASATLKTIRTHNNIRFSNYIIFLVAFFPEFLRKYILSKWGAYKSIRSKN